METPTLPNDCYEDVPVRGADGKVILDANGSAKTVRVVARFPIPFFRLEAITNASGDRETALSRETLVSVLKVLPDEVLEGVLDEARPVAKS